MTSIVSIKKINQLFRTGFWLNRIQVLHDVNLEVPEKSIYGFLGPNGAGKTTLIHILVGIRKAASGTIQIRSQDIQKTQTRSLLGYLPERPYFHEHLTGEGLLRYLGTLSKMNRQKLESRISEVLEIVGLADARKKELRHYSKGMLQRIGIAQAILHSPPFLVLDEPMSGLDPVGRKEIRELILTLSRQGHTVFFSSHVIPDVEAICDQVAIIEKGQIHHAGSLKSLLSSTTQSIEIACSKPKNLTALTQLNWLELRENTEGYLGRISGDTDVNDWLQKVISAGSHIFSVVPIRLSLENYFQSSTSKKESGV